MSLVCAAALALAGCAHRFDSRQVTAADYTATLPPPSGVPAPVAAAIEYRISAFDKISVKMFGVADLDREGQVDASGGFSMPLVGTQRAGGLTADEFARSLEAAYAGRYLRHPQVTVTVLEAAGQQVTIEGGVAKPGFLPVAGSTSLLRTIAAAGGTTEDAESRDVLVYRDIDGKRMVARFDLTMIRTGQAPDPALYGNDVVVVGSSGNGKLIRAATALAPLTSIFYLLTQL